MAMIKKKVFIGSSSEELPLAEQAKLVLEPEFEVIIWNESLWDDAVFKLNNNYLADLLKATLKFDFGILIGSKDDKVEYRGAEVLQPRDNILFELGLFIGRIGVSKCAFLVDEDIKILSDFHGISLARYNKHTYINEVKRIKEQFLATPDNNDLNFFPSATLAAIYYENFIAPTCQHLVNNNGFDFESVHYPINKTKIKILVPNDIHNDVNIQFQRLKSAYSCKDTTIEHSGRSRNITIDCTDIEGDEITIIDFPTIVTGIKHCIKNAFPSDYETLSNDYKDILDREVRRFITSLKYLLLHNGYDEMVVVERDPNITYVIK